MNFFQTTLVATITSIITFGMALPVDAKQWNCRNRDLEISCGEGHCDSQPDGTFTPMSIHLDETGPVEICAYSGCWRGMAIVDKHGRFLLFTGLKLKWNEREDNTTDFAVIVDEDDKVGILKGAGFAHPFTCR